MERLDTRLNRELVNPNKKNLLRMANFIATIPRELFDMGSYRKPKNADENDNYWTSHVCGSVGCVIGHCTVLDTLENVKKFVDGDHMSYGLWSDGFTGIDSLSDDWEWLFGSTWVDIDNTPLGASLRIKDYLINGLPANWMKQKNGIEELGYKLG